MIVIHWTIIVSLIVSIYNLDSFDIWKDILYFMIMYSIPMGYYGYYLNELLSSNSSQNEDQVLYYTINGNPGIFEYKC